MSRFLKWRSSSAALRGGALITACFFAGCAARHADDGGATLRPDGTHGAERADETLDRFTYTRIVMGAPCTITLYAAGRAHADTAVRAAYERLARIEESLSDWVITSEVRCLPTTAGVTTTVGPDLAAVLARCDTAWRGTRGAFDPTVAPVVAVWREARRSGCIPRDAHLDAAMRAVGWANVRIGNDPATFTPLVDGMRLDFGGIGQGYGSAEALRVLHDEGIRHALVDLSGDLAALDAPPGTPGWRVDIAGETLLLANAALTVSGDEVQHLDEPQRGGVTVRHSHIVNPATGRALTTRVSVCVVSPDPVAADFLATALAVLGPGHGIPTGVFDFAARWTIENSAGPPLVVHTPNWPGAARAQHDTR